MHLFWFNIVNFTQPVASSAKKATILEKLLVLNFLSKVINNAGQWNRVQHHGLENIIDLQFHLLI